MELNEDRYEAIHLIIKSPKTDKPDDSWFDRIFDFITSFCTGSDTEGTCACGMESMGGSGGTLDQCYDYERITEKWAQDVQANDLKRALLDFEPVNDEDWETYERLRKAAFWHDDFNDWVANLPDDEDEEDDLPELSHLEHYQHCNCLADSGTCCREVCSTCKGEDDDR